MFNLGLCDAATIRYSQLKFGHKHLCGVDYKDFSPHCCKCNSFSCTAAIRCGKLMHAAGPIAIASIQVASTANSIHRGYSSMKRASPTHGRRWLAQTNYDALMTHHTTENISLPSQCWLSKKMNLAQQSLTDYSWSPFGDSPTMYRLYNFLLVSVCCPQCMTW